MSDDPVTTRIATDNGLLHFQEYLVKHGAQLPVKGIQFEGIEVARPAPGLEEAILASEAILVCPSNPLISIGPILGVQGVRSALRSTAAMVVAVSPLVGGASLKGPTDRMLQDVGLEASAAQVARLYEDFLDVFIMDQVDRHLEREIGQLGMEVVVANTVMEQVQEKIALAELVVSILPEPTA